MISEDEFAVWIARAFLSGDEHQLEAMVLDALAEDARQGAGLEAELARARASERRAGAFGMEIAGAFLVPVLVEIGRELWSSYAKELAAKLGKRLADVTVTQVKDWLKGRTGGGQQPAVQADLEATIRRVGAAQQLSAEQIDALVAAVREGRVVDELQHG